jgi:hypothetical protein
MELFRNSKVNIEYLYSSLEGQVGKAVAILRMDDHEKALEIITANKLPTVESL